MSKKEYKPLTIEEAPNAFVAVSLKFNQESVDLDGPLELDDGGTTTILNSCSTCSRSIVERRRGAAAEAKSTEIARIPVNERSAFLKARSSSVYEGRIEVADNGKITGSLRAVKS